MVAYLRSLREELLPRKENATVLDLGTGNGGLLFRLKEEGGSFRGRNMFGIDYSEGSVGLARRLQEERGLKVKQARERHYMSRKDDEVSKELASQDELPQTAPEAEAEDGIRFELYDVLSTSTAPPPWFPPSGFDVALDKGTFDAISLSDAIDPETGKRACERYAERVASLVKRGGLVLITCCNWTEEELVGWFTRPWLETGMPYEGFQVVGRIDYKKFKFGGVEGQAVCSVCFRRI